MMLIIKNNLKIEKRILKNLEILLEDIIKYKILGFYYNTIIMIKIEFINLIVLLFVYLIFY
jgi:hypothetical protein